MKGFNKCVSRFDRCRREVLRRRDEGGGCLRHPLPGAGRRQPGRLGGGRALSPPLGHQLLNERLQYPLRKNILLL